MVKGITKETLNKIKEFAEKNFGKEVEEGAIYADDEEFAVTNPWYDHTGRFPLNDVEAVEEWGLEIVIQFCDRVRDYLNLD